MHRCSCCDKCVEPQCTCIQLLIYSKQQSLYKLTLNKITLWSEITGFRQSQASHLPRDKWRSPDVGWGGSAGCGGKLVLEVTVQLTVLPGYAVFLGQRGDWKKTRKNINL